MANQKNNKESEGDNALTALILAYDSSKGAETLDLITATRQFLEMHFEKGKPLSYTQLRNVLLEVKKHENLGLIIPKLAYMEAKLDDINQKKLVEFLRILLETALRQGKEKAFREYMDMFVAFHKYYSTLKK
jgi:hypothetical protein